MTGRMRIGRGEALQLLQEEEFLSLGRRADAERARRHPHGRVTFVVDRNINFTNVCTCQCRFCAFYRKPGDAEGYVLSYDQVLDKVQELVDRGGTQVLMQGGLNPDLGLEWFEGLFQVLKRRFPQVQNHSLSPAEIVHIGRLAGLDVEQTLERLAAAGLDSVPGGGAEVLVDRVRREISPNKISWREWTGVMEAAHELGMPTTATLMFGVTETDADIVDHLLRVREVQDRTGGFTAFIPWTFQPNFTELGNSEGIGGTGAVRYLRVLALARLVLDNVENIQGSWVTQGEKVAQVSLRFGANDLGGTMLEENVVAAAGVHFRLGQDRLVELIAGAGFRPAQRDTRYRVLREFEGDCHALRGAEDQRWQGGSSMASSTETVGKERRKDERFDRSVPLRVGHDSSDGVRAESINISTRGLYCKVTRYVQPFSKTRVCLELPFVARATETLECDGVVVRVEPDVEAPGIDEYRLAIYFLNLGTAQTELIEDFLAEAH